MAVKLPLGGLASPASSMPQHRMVLPVVMAQVW